KTLPRKRDQATVTGWMSPRPGRTSAAAGELTLQPRHELIPIRPSHVDAGVVAQDRDQVAAEPVLHLAHAIEVHDRGAVHADEACRVQPLGEVREGAAHHVLRAAGMNDDV